MSRKSLPGVVATVLSPRDAAQLTEAQRTAICAAALAYAAAYKTWTERGGYAPTQRTALHRALEELLAAAAIEVKG